MKLYKAKHKTTNNVNLDKCKNLFIQLHDKSDNNNNWYFPKMAIIIMVNQLTNRIKLTCGVYHAILLDVKNQIYSFGWNVRGQLGLNDDCNRNLPTRLTMLPKEMGKIIKITCGEQYNMLIDDKNQIYAFGSNYYGQLGSWDQEDKSIIWKLTLPEGVGKIAGISCGGSHTVLFDDKSQIYAFGKNKYGQLGLYHTSTNQLPKKLIKMPKDVGKIVKIQCGGNHTLLFDDKCQIQACGKNKYGQLGLGDQKNRNIPEKLINLPKGIGKIIKISSGGSHSFIIDDKNQIQAFGKNNFGQLGLGDNTNRNSPEKITQLPEGIGQIIKLTCGGNHTLLIDNKRLMYAFGSNDSGQLGLGDQNERTVPEKLEKLPEGIGKIIKITCGGSYTLIIDNKHKIYAFGSNKYGQLGLGKLSSKKTPTYIEQK